MKPRRDQKPYLTRSLSADQARQLRRWLFIEEITYAQAGKRLKERFGIVANRMAIFNFYHRHAKPMPRDIARGHRRVALDLIIKTKGDRIQFLMHQRDRFVKVTVNGRPLRTGVTGSAKNIFSNFSPGLAAVDSARRRRQEEHQTGREAFSSP
ncbi:MAG TPA: hypothetical protein VHZ30_03115 [Verrucomicrobiae bacterium]|nr:hypothetical protein [Verrucomicrobiae bacterium]